jgi:hypothetical protein
MKCRKKWVDGSVGWQECEWCRWSSCPKSECQQKLADHEPDCKKTVLHARAIILQQEQDELANKRAAETVRKRSLFSTEVRAGTGRLRKRSRANTVSD